MKNSFEFKSTLWQRNNWEDKWSWYFITLPIETWEAIIKIVANQPRKWRWAVKVKVRIGFMDWETSIFPDSKRWSYLLPIKAEIRKELRLKEWNEIMIYLELI